MAKLSIWITSDKASSGTITMANGAFSSTFNILANGLAEIPIPFNVAHITFLESSNGTTINILKKSIRVKVDAGKPAVVAYVQEFGNARSTATLLLPVNVLGKKYYSMNFNQIGGGNVTLSGQTFVPRSQFHIIAVKDNTVVTVTPVKNGVKQAPFTFTLPLAGDMIQYQSGDGAAATQDLTGTLIESVASGSGGCLPIAVFSGSSNVTLGTQTPFCSGGSYDPLFQQLYPVSTWGKNFGFVPLSNYPSGVPYRVMAAEDNTNVSINGAFVATLNAGEIYPAAFTGNPATLTQPTAISADKPICVAEYAQSSGCAGNGPGGNQGDPDMVLLNPIEQNISDITIFSTRQEVINSQWINVVMKTIATPSFRISRNGCALAPPNSAWQTFAALPGYSYLRELLPVPGTGTCSGGPLSDSYRLVADSGFNAIAYGLGTNETYAYSAGTYIKDLNSPGVVSGFGIENNKVCTGESFKIKVPLPYLADSIYWDLSGLPGAYPNEWTYYPPSTPDSITGPPTKPIYWYSLTTNFSIATLGVHPIKVTTYSQNTDGCGSEQDVEFEIEITAPPVSEFTWIAPRCAAETAQFNDASIAPNPFYKWWWDFGDPASGAAN
ncbi:MAG TPA: IgGFc-binding protein, partial [Ferruginibacter sp.]|nr:IgGFc-binding protein [Ferruginibacter sp.]